MTAKVTLLFTLLSTLGCSYLPPIPYRIDVQQGNVVTEEMTETLKPGMTKPQVMFVMGSPLIVDAFRQNRWDYVYIFREAGRLTEQKRLTLFFEDDILATIENHQVYPKDKTKKDSIKIEQAEKNTSDTERNNPDEPEAK